jgi:2-polyprenyl-3-methyl-5-hydroxy-6-metoxy-1,4-benzoquinol methylase
MFEELKDINSRPEPFEFYTADELWTNEHTSKQMLAYHLNESIDVSSRKAEFIDRSVEWIVSYFGVESDSEIADFGCGPGLYASRLAKQGANVTGIDFSKNSIKFAREVAERDGQSIDYIHANYLEYETEKKFDLIIMIMCDFCALSPEQRKVMLTIFQSLLKPGGSVLLDVYSLISFSKKEESATYELNQLNRFWSPDDYYCFVNTFKYEKEKVTLDKYTIIEESRTRAVYNWLQHFSPETLEKEFIDSGFTIDKFYSDVAGSPLDPESPEIAIVAKKQ